MPSLHCIISNKRKGSFWKKATLDGYTHIYIGTLQMGLDIVHGSKCAVSSSSRPILNVLHLSLAVESIFPWVLLIIRLAPYGRPG